MFNTDQLRQYDTRTIAVPNAIPYPASSEYKRDEVKDYIRQYVNLSSSGTFIFRTKFPNYMTTLNGHCKQLVHLHKLNNLLRVNDFLRDVNQKLPVNGVFACCIETLEQRNERIFKEDKGPLNKIFYFSDFVIHRVFPKLYLTRKIYFWLYKGNNRAISLPEILGRFVYCGFNIIDFKKINNLTYLITEKEGNPLKNQKPSYGLFIKMNRIGKDGRIINVHKFRTMFPYSEYIQKLVYEHNNLKPGGKFQNDFRITGWGKIMRKYWIDEFPMFINVFKGEMKLVGLRPLSQQYLSLYNPKMQDKRFTLKPGLVPPYYYDLPKTLIEIMKSEEKYIDAYTRDPVITDIRYFFIAVKNILFKGARSS